MWHTHTHEEKCNLYLNARYIIQTINVHASADRVKQVGTLPFMQLQGLSNHCGVCAFNNVAGQEVTNVPEMNEAADELWLEQFEKIGCLVTDDIQRHRDSNGFHSFETLEIIGSKHGLKFVVLDSCIRSLLGREFRPELSSLLIRELQQCYQFPVDLLMLDRDSRVQHYTVAKVYHHIIWYFDSMKQKPFTITADTLFKILANETCITFHVSKHKDPITQEQMSPSAMVSSLEIVIYYT